MHVQNAVREGLHADPFSADVSHPHPRHKPWTIHQVIKLFAQVLAQEDLGQA